MYIADLHIHSKYSRATSRDCDAPYLDLWARRKGIGLLGTGDFTHPAWRAELREALVPAEEGLYTLRPELVLSDETAGVEKSPRFVVSGEISSIYKKNGRTRKVHNVILLPGLDQADALAQRLEVIGNIHSDGRPILGLDSRDLLEITLEACPQAVFIPAHIWTPHFSLFGAFSGFDTIEECFEDLTPYIHALETGLSSDPPMNWRVSALDRFLLISNSDAHSPAKLGREANLLEGELSYPGLARALSTGSGFGGTLEFFPEEGKYHLDGHRNCGLRLTPAETAQLGGRCPVCGKKITIGVQHRVEELADRPEGYVLPGAKGFQSLVPLPEVIAASTGFSAGSVRTSALYEGLLAALGPEFYILREAPLEEIGREAGLCVAEGIRRLRIGQVDRTGGYDGEYGIISLLAPEEREALSGQVSLFGAPAARSAPHKAAKKAPAQPMSAPVQPSAGSVSAGDLLNQEQLLAVTASEKAVAVVAGPGTGKTKTLVSRIAYLVEERGVRPSEITAVTFTNQAAAEMRQRLEEQLGGRRAVSAMTIGTFHSICLRLLGNAPLISEAEALAEAARVLRELDGKGSPRQLLRKVSLVKNGMSFEDAQLSEDIYNAYRARLGRLGVLDFDDLLLDALAKDFSGKRCFGHLLVDEFQDIDSLQYRLVSQWSRRGTLFVIGDPDQSIYGFRGASGRCFSQLEEDVPQLRLIRLLHNYRSTPQVLGCALPVISRNPGGERVLLPFRPDGAPVRLLTADSDFAEAVFIAKEVARLTGGVDMLEAERQSASQRELLRSFSDIAVLCRTHRQLELIEKCLRRDDIPCVISGREDFLQDEEVRGVLGFFRSLLDPMDRASLLACLRLIWQCPADLLDQASGAAVSGEWDPDALSAAFGDGPLSLWAAAVKEYLPKAAREKPRKLLEQWLAGRDPSPAMNRLLNTAVFHKDMPAFLHALVLGQEADLQRASGKSYTSGAVRLMTLHGSKGLEFPVVFLAGLLEGVLPLESAHRPSDPEEERRLFFVGMTRAREELILLTSPHPSPFLADLPGGKIEKGRTGGFRPRPETQQLSLF